MKFHKKLCQSLFFSLGIASGRYRNYEISETLLLSDAGNPAKVWGSSMQISGTKIVGLCRSRPALWESRDFHGLGDTKFRIAVPAAGIRQLCLLVHPVRQGCFMPHRCLGGQWLTARSWPRMIEAPRTATHQRLACKKRTLSEYNYKKRKYVKLLYSNVIFGPQCQYI